MDWILHKGDTPSKETGPKVDHTHGTAEGSINIDLGDINRRFGSRGATKSVMAVQARFQKKTDNFFCHINTLVFERSRLF